MNWFKKIFNKKESVSDKNILHEDITKYNYVKITKRNYIFWNKKKIFYLFDNIDMTFYDSLSNIMKTFSDIKEYNEVYKFNSYMSISKPLLLEEYENELSSVFECNCEIGDGSKPQIEVAKYYDIEEEYNNNQDKYYIEFHGTLLRDENNYYDVYDNCEYICSINYYPINFAQKACLNCETCLDEKNKLIDYIQDKIDEVILENEKEIEKINLVKEICEKASN